MMKLRTDRFMALVLAECYYWNGAYLRTIKSDVISLASQKTWVLPVHDKRLKSFSGTYHFVDLYSAEVGALLSQSLFLLRGSLDTETITTVVSSLRLRIVIPVLNSLRRNWWQWWIDTTNNWNAVCWALVNVAVHSYPVASLDEAAEISTAAWAYGADYLKSYTEDNYASEGIVYFNYGFSNFIVLREALMQATGGFIDMFTVSPTVTRKAFFAIEFGMSNTNYANFGDSFQNAAIDQSIIKYVALTFGIEDPSAPGTDLVIGGGFTSIAYGLFDPTPSRISTTTITTRGMNDFRKFYPISGVLVARPSENSRVVPAGSIAATFKLAGNGGHSHNDIGSYVLSVKGVTLTGDPGGPKYYEARTFDSRRYDSVLLNSYGHPVPLVNGRVQVIADTLVSSRIWKSRNRLLYSMFSNARDELLFDLTPAYNDPTLLNLTRAVVYNRQSRGLVEITDSVSFSTPGSFETALIAIFQWTQTSPDSGFFWLNSTTKIYARVSCPFAFRLTSTREGDYGVDFTRIGIRLNNPVTSASVRVTFWTE